MIRLDIEGEQKWTAWVIDEFGQELSHNLSVFRTLGSDGRRLIKLIVRNLEGKRPKSQNSQLTKIRVEIGGAVHELKLSALPRSESEWQDFVISLYEHCLGRKNYSKNLSNRIKDWNAIIAPHLEALRDAHDLIPLGVEIPKARVSDAAIEHARKHVSVLGQPAAISVSKPQNKTLVSISLSRTDAEYLDEIRDSLSEKRRILRGVLLKWWYQIKEHYEYGEKLLKDTDLDALLDQLKAFPAFSDTEKRIRDNSRLVNGRTESSLGNLLSLMHHFHGSVCKSSYFKKSTLYLPCHAAVWLPPSVPESVSTITSTFDKINWMLGSLSHMDISVCSALLAMSNPAFTPQSLIFAKIYDKHGMPHLEIDNAGLHFRVEKPRAKKMNDSGLDDISHEIISTIIRMTSRYRANIQESNPAVGSLLFLCWRPRAHDAHGAPNVDQVQKKLRGYTGAGAGKDDIYSYFPEIEAVLPRGSISLSRIRATEGVLEWFKHGSIKSMSRKLGNTESVSLNHYIPRALLAAWNTRLIRRFQNLWLAVAAANESFLLSVTDFHTLEDLHLFLADMLRQHSAKSSPLGRELHERFAVQVGQEEQHNVNSGSLAVSISLGSLTYLYLYQEAVLASGVGASELDYQDPISGLSPRYFLELAQLLRHQLPTHRNPDLRKLHEAAESKVGVLVHEVHWTDLLLKRGRVQRELD